MGLWQEALGSLFMTPILVTAPTKLGILPGHVEWSNEKGAYIVFIAFAAPHGWYTWDKIVKLDPPIS